VRMPRRAVRVPMRMVVRVPVRMEVSHYRTIEWRRRACAG
jgi:hypothetical protein